MTVPFNDLKPQYHTIKEQIDIRLNQTFEKGDFILGQPVKDFESEFAQFCEAKYAIGVNSGTDALYIALSSLDIEVGDEVILPTHTFIATALCISYTGAKPVFVDIEDETYNMDPVALEKAITDKTKVIIPVHLYGQAANMDEILAIAKERNIKVIEDACQAHGARYKGKRVGSLADAACFSFYPGKGLGAFGDGGMIITNDEDVFKQASMLRDYGRASKYEHKIKGYNSRLDTVQAIILSEKLKHLDQWNETRIKRAALYGELLKDVSGVKLPIVKDNRTHVYQTYATLVNDRDRVLEEMKGRGVQVIIHYPIPLHLQPAYQELGYKQGDFPVAENLANTEMSLPMFPHMTEEHVQEVCKNLKEVL